MQQCRFLPSTGVAVDLQFADNMAFDAVQDTPAATASHTQWKVSPARPITSMVLRDHAQYGAVLSFLLVIDI